MSKRIVRHNHSGGQLGAPLLTRSDLEHYHKANRIQNNFLATPYGGVERRPPLVHVGVLPFITVDGTVYYPQNARGFAFVYDADTKYDVLLVSYTDKADPEDVFSRFVIFDHATGTQKDYVECNYAQDEFFELDTHQVNDVMFVVHQNHAPARLERHADTSWELVDCTFSYGPFLDLNTDRTIELSLYGESYDSGTTYSPGKVVQLGSGSPVSITAAEYVYWKGSGYTTENTMRLTVGAAHGFSSGDQVYIDSLDSVDQVFDGQYEIVRTGTTTIDINPPSYTEYQQFGRVSVLVRVYYTIPSDFTGSTVQGGNGIGFYVCTAESTGNDPASSPDYWRRTYTDMNATVQCTQEIFAESDVGRKILMSAGWNELDTGSFDQSTSGQTSTWLPARGTVSVETSGVWGGELRLAYSIDDGQKWETIARVDGLSGDKNHSFSRDIGELGAMVRLESDGWTSFSGETSLIYTINVENSTDVSMDITAFTDARTVSVSVEGVVKYSFSTWLFALGAFGGIQGYPAAVAVHEERLLLAGTIGRPFSIYGSSVNDWENFAAGTLATSPITFQAQSDRVTRISWMLSRDRLYFGTDFGEYTAGASDSDSVLSAENPPSVKRHTSYGSARIKAIAVHDRIIFVLPDSKTVRTMEERDYTTSFTSKDLTVFSSDIAADGLRSLCLQRTPYTVVWGVRTDGSMVSFTFDPENDIMGWAVHPVTGATIKSAWTVPDADSVDEVTCVIELDDSVVSVDSSSATPDLSMDYYIGAPTAIEIQGLTTYSQANRLLGSIGIVEGYIAFHYEFLTGGYDYRIRISGLVDGLYEWRLEALNGDESLHDYIAYAYNDSLTNPPKTGWTLADDTNEITPPVIVYDGAFVGQSLPYYTIDKAVVRDNGQAQPSGYRIYGSDITTPLFESATRYGTYTAVSGSGATGTVEVQELSYNICRMDQSESEHTDCLNGPSERAMESLIEPTSLLQGEGMLEADKVRVSKVLLYLVESQGGEISVDGGSTWSSISYDDGELFTGLKQMRVDSGNLENLRLQIRTTGTKPFQLTGLAVEVEQQTTKTGRGR